MTAEVAIMNQHALIFAADSATTVTHWIKGKQEVRYFKGANKLFQLSDVHPVGLMIFGSAGLHSVPWEIIVKDFRAHLGTESSDSISGYRERFFRFVEGHSALFPDEMKQRLFLENATMAAFFNARMLKEDESVKQAEGQDQVNCYLNKLTELEADVARLEVPVPLTPEDIEAAVAAHAVEITRRIREEIGPEYVIDLGSAPRLADVSIRAAMKRHDLFLGESGIVIGGYGQKDYFPSFEAYKCRGFLERHFIAIPEENPATITNEIPAIIRPFATTSMINTFRLGISPDVHQNVDDATRKCLTDFAARIAERIEHEGDIPGIEQMVEDALQEHRKEWFSQSFSSHHSPMARVIASLPVAEMAALAKSLIELQSLKERVTKPSESVGGPIDVAAISKHDGFIWIERKHYFRPELNPRFFTRRYGATH